MFSWMLTPIRSCPWVFFSGLILLIGLNNAKILKKNFKNKTSTELTWILAKNMWYNTPSNSLNKILHRKSHICSWLNPGILSEVDTVHFSQYGVCLGKSQFTLMRLMWHFYLINYWIGLFKSKKTKKSLSNSGQYERHNAKNSPQKIRF